MTNKHVELIRADLHLHTNRSSDGGIAPERLVEIARRRGLDCIAVTDHNTIEAAQELVNETSLRVIVGEEVKSDAGEIIGYFLQEPIPKGLPPLEVVRRIKEQGGLVCVPHPFDRLRQSVLRRSALREILPYVDIIEGFNSRCVIPQDNGRARHFAAEHGLACSAGSDAHIGYEVGRGIVEMAPFEGPEEFLQSLRHATIRGRLSVALVHFASTWNKWRRPRRI